MKSWALGKTVEIRSPNATRPWQHVLEPLSGYLTLGAELDKSENLIGESFNFGPRSEKSRNVIELLNDLSRQWLFNSNFIPYRIADNIPFHEAGLLKLNCDKALFLLNWEANLTYEECVIMVGDWYCNFYKTRNKSNLYDFTMKQIENYENLALERNRIWCNL